MASDTMATRSPDFSWGAAILGGCVAIAGGAFFGTLVSTVSVRLAMADGLSVEQANSAYMGSGFSLLTIVPLILTLLSEAAGGYVAAMFGRTKAFAHAAGASMLPLLFLAIMWGNPSSQFGPLWYTALSFLSPVLASLAGAYLFTKRA